MDIVRASRIHTGPDVSQHTKVKIWNWFDCSVHKCKWLKVRGCRPVLVTFLEFCDRFCDNLSHFVTICPNFLLSCNRWSQAGGFAHIQGQQVAKDFRSSLLFPLVRGAFDITEDLSQKTREGRHQLRRYLKEVTLSLTRALFWNTSETRFPIKGEA